MTVVINYFYTFSNNILYSCYFPKFSPSNIVYRLNNILCSCYFPKYSPSNIAY